MPLLDGEHVVRRQSASYLVGGKSVWGGQLVLTSQRLVFRLLNLGAVTKMMQDGVEFLPDNLAVLGKVVDTVLDYTTAYGDRLAGGVVNTATITRAAPGLNAGVFLPPSLLVLVPGRRSVEIGILHMIGVRISFR